MTYSLGSNDWPTDCPIPGAWESAFGAFATNLRGLWSAGSPGGKSASHDWANSNADINLIGSVTLFLIGRLYWRRASLKGTAGAPRAPRLSSASFEDAVLHCSKRMAAMPDKRLCCGAEKVILCMPFLGRFLP
jgi:hypothetical protein